MISKHYNASISTDHAFIAKSDFKVEMSYCNRSTSDITMVTRDNLPITLPKLKAVNSYNDIVIRKTYCFNSYYRITELLTTLQDIYVKCKQYPSEDVRLIYQAINKQPPNNRNANIAIVHIDRYIDTKEIIENGCIYSVDADVALYHGVANHTMLHPYSQKALSEDEPREVIKQLPRELTGITLQIVDNDNYVSQQYAYCFNELYDIPIIKDDSRDNGIYVSRINRDSLSTQQYPLSGLKDLGIYPNKEEAMTNGQIDLIHQKEVGELKRKLEKEALQNKQTIQDLQREADERKRIAEDAKHKLELEADERKRVHEAELNKLKLQHEEDMRELEKKRYETKDHYEHRSYERKESTETLKTVGILVASILSITALIKK